MLRLTIILMALICADLSHATAQADELSALNKRVLELYRDGKYAEATALARSAVEMGEAQSVRDHQSFGTSLNNLAALYRAQGRHREAEPLYKRSLSLRETALGRNHPDVGTTLNNLASLYKSQGKYSEALPLHKRALDIAEKTLGPNHPNVGATLNNLAALYRAQGSTDAAEPLYRRTLQIVENTLGAHHPHAATTLNNLAGLYEDQGRYTAAEPLYKRALSIRERSLGPDHPDLATTLNDLAALFANQGRYVEAEPLYKRALSIRTSAFRPAHPAVGASLNNLAALYHDQDRLTEAEPLYGRALNIFEKAYGPEHPDVGSALNNLAGLYESQGRYADAIRLSTRALAIREKVLGATHPEVGMTLSNLAALYRFDGRAADAISLYRRSIEIVERALGAAHPHVATNLTQLAVLYHAEGNAADAELLYKRAFKIYQAALGPDHPYVGTSLENIARLYNQLGRHAEEASIRARLSQMPRAGTRHLPVYFATSRKRTDEGDRRRGQSAALFGPKPAQSVSLGRVVMQVPAEAVRRLASDRAANLRLDRGREKLTAADVFKPVHHNLLSRQEFRDSLKGRLRRTALAKDQALIFVHGFNVDFDVAVKRLSQIAFDLEFDGALVAFSWPSVSNPDPVSYWTDTSRADASVDRFVGFLDQLSEDLPGVTLHVLAHSMGNRILTRALQKIAARASSEPRLRLGEVILAHADATTAWCAKLGQARPHVRGITNYANRDDAALRVSSTIRGGEARCGLNPQGYEGIETIDTTGMGGARESLVSVMFGANNHHGVFANDPLLFGEISRLITSGQRPVHLRTQEFVQRKDDQGKTYWAFDQSRMLGANVETVKAD